MESNTPEQAVPQQTTPISQPELPPQQESSSDISKNTILMLLVLTVFVSAFGTWTILKATEQGLPQIQIQTLEEVPKGTTTQSGIVAVSIGPKPQPIPPKPVTATGYVTLNIINPKA